MNIREEFWEKYKNINQDYREAKASWGVLDEDIERDYIRDVCTFVNRAKSKRWICYDLLQAKYETLEDPMERVKNLGMLKDYNEHDAYLVEGNMLQDDCNYFIRIGKNGGECPLISKAHSSCEVCMAVAKEINRTESIDERNEEWTIIMYGVDEYDKVIKRVANQQKLIVNSVLDHAEFKTFQIEKNKKGESVFAIYRYKDQTRKELYYRAEVPYVVMAKQILALDTFRSKLTIEEQKLCIAYSKQGRCMIKEKYIEI